ncbi:uncharacterized protein THITE_2112202 [Thermothielavioides terrestris NRRL 8126]|uniref:Uncharacterized protein n=1 Tax=Thermothielavioides terrestris (strain ATCC 38088 / NRRL 8126) TaxID=578455 RepID=G2QY33_THETT|nr:uncharacterized protein THITE_2112202 [Thermothielavioides terrestris NRRL 8126]AEO65327.1 hypothetical protein THITE_2112202 [Thermothielavioides terrestris NRRL 8126]
MADQDMLETGVCLDSRHSYEGPSLPASDLVQRSAAAYVTGKGIKNRAEKQEDSVAGAIAAAHSIPLRRSPLRLCLP